MERRQFLFGAAAASAAFAAGQAEATQGEMKQAAYAIVELMGYKKLCGKLQQSPIPGMLQLDVPIEGGYSTQMINPQSVYRITLCDEKTVREFARAIDPLPAIELQIPPTQGRLHYGYEEEYDEFG